MHVRVEYHREADGWWAASPDADGFTAAGDTFAEVREQARGGLAFHFDRDDIEIEEVGAPGVTAWTLQLFGGFEPADSEAVAEYMKDIQGHTALTAG